MPYFLQAGPVRVRYESGFLRYFSLDGAEVLRMIYLAIRDHHWRTAALTISDELIDKETDSFRIQYTWQIDDLGIQMVGQVTIQGQKNGEVTVDVTGRAQNTFRKNRIGLCILHPIGGVLGQPIVITEPDGAETTGHFPTYISPHQPFLNIQSLRWKPAAGPALQLDFSGDVFEMEDQRNWTDASFKTYSTPLSQPFPVTVSEGDTFQQQVRFSLAEQQVKSPEHTPERTPESIQPVVHNQPRIGVGQRADGKPLTDEEAIMLRRLNLSYLRTDVFFSLPDWQTHLANACHDAVNLNLPLELAVFFGDDPTAEFRLVQNALQNQPATVYSTLLFDAVTLTTSDKLVKTVVPLIRAVWPDVLIGGGTDDNFAELNRNRFDVEPIDFVTYSIQPQAHATDDLTLLENIAGQAETVLTARQFSAGKPVHISPITLRSRFTTLANSATERQTAPADPRQQTAFGADWTRQSLAGLTAIGVASVTYYQTHGPAGLVDGGKKFPVYEVFQAFDDPAGAS